MLGGLFLRKCLINRVGGTFIRHLRVTTEKSTIDFFSQKISKLGADGDSKLMIYFAWP